MIPFILPSKECKSVQNEKASPSREIQAGQRSPIWRHVPRVPEIWLNQAPELPKPPNGR